MEVNSKDEVIKDIVVSSLFTWITCSEVKQDAMLWGISSSSTEGPHRKELKPSAKKRGPEQLYKDIWIPSPRICVFLGFSHNCPFYYHWPSIQGGLFSLAQLQMKPVWLGLSLRLKINRLTFKNKEIKHLTYNNKTTKKKKMPRNT